MQKTWNKLTSLTKRKFFAFVQKGAGFGGWHGGNRQHGGQGKKRDDFQIHDEEKNSWIKQEFFMKTKRNASRELLSGYHLKRGSDLHYFGNISNYSEISLHQFEFRISYAKKNEDDDKIK